MTVHTITATQAFEWLSSGEACLIDVRTPKEFNEEHIAYAASLPLDLVSESFEKMCAPKNKKIIVQCLKGGRAAQACGALESHHSGQYDIYNIEGGILAWKDAGLPVVSSSSLAEVVVSTMPLSIFRQVQIIFGMLVALFVTLGFLGIIGGFILAGFLGAVFFMAGVTGWCGLSMLLQRMPWNKR